ncbi:MAG: ferritin family protein [Desulfobacteraceae bacterium]|nr:ferritin family protein [Desulfobacteraceae bacterium]
MGRVILTGDESPLEIIVFAYGMEQGLGEFYSSAAGMIEDKDVAGLLRKLARIEENHRLKLLDIYMTLNTTGRGKEAFEAEIMSEMMEGGFTTKEFLEKNRPVMETTANILSLAMMLETQALDLYLRYSQKAEDEESRRVLYRIAEDEKAHLAALGDMMETAHNGE